LNTVTVPTSLSHAPRFGRAVKVISPTLFEGHTFLASREQLWALLRPPVDPSAKDPTDQHGLYKVTDEEPIKVGEGGSWSTKIDIGRGDCDEGKQYHVYIIRSRPTRGAAGSIIDGARQHKTYPEFRSIPSDSKIVGRARVILSKYEGEHHSCPR